MDSWQFCESYRSYYDTLLFLSSYPVYAESKWSSSNVLHLDLIENILEDLGNLNWLLANDKSLRRPLIMVIETKKKSDRDMRRRQRNVPGLPA